MYEVIVDGQSLKDLIFVTDVNRTMGPAVKDRIIVIHCYVFKDVLATIDVLNKLFTGDIQEFIFTDQPDRYWLGKVKEDIEVSSSYENAQFDIEIEVPDGVSYALVPKELSFKGRETLILENDGSDIAYPTFDFTLKDETYMTSVVGKEDIFQFGEPIEASPLKEVEITKSKTTDGHEARRSYTSIDKRVRDLSYSSFNINNIKPNWKSAGSFVERKKGMPSPSNGKIKVGRWATHWQTGERIANWVKGRTFNVSESKNVRHSKSKKAYLLTNRGVWVGWLLEQDIDGSATSGFAANNNNSGDMVVSWASGQGYSWHGPCRSYSVDLDCTNFRVETYLNYFITNASQYGAYYIGVLSGDELICGTSFSTHQNNRSTYIYFDAYGNGLNGTGAKQSMASNFWGKISMEKKDERFTFKVFNDMSKKSYTKTYNLEDKDLKPTRIVIWAGKYGNGPGPYEVSAVRLKFTGLNALVYVKAKTEQVKELVNLPDPRYVYKAGDVIRLEMSTNKAYVNGIETLSPIAYGSNNVGLKPGKNEIFLDICSDQVADVDVYYRERFK